MKILQLIIFFIKTYYYIKYQIFNYISKLEISKIIINITKNIQKENFHNKLKKSNDDLMNFYKIYIKINNFKKTNAIINKFKKVQNNQYNKQN